MSSTTGQKSTPTNTIQLEDDNKLLILFGSVVASAGQYLIAEFTPENPPNGTIIASSPESSLMLLLGCVVASLGTVLVLKGAPKLPAIASRTQKTMGTFIDVIIGAIALLTAGFFAWLGIEFRMAMTSKEASIGDLAIVGGITLAVLVLSGIILVLLYKYFYKELASIQKIATQPLISNPNRTPTASTLVAASFMIIILIIGRK